MSEHRDVSLPKGTEWVLVASGPDEFWVQGEDNWHCRVAATKPDPEVGGPKLYADENLNLRLEAGESLWGRNPTRSVNLFVIGASA